MTRPRAQTAALATLIAIVAVVAFTGGVIATHLIRGSSARPAGSAPAAVAGAGSTPSPAPPAASAPLPAPAAVRSQLQSAASDSVLGDVRASVRDAVTGASLYDQAGSTPAPPASTAKLLTAAAVLAVHQPQDRISTTVVRGAGSSVVLVGGGDPTLTAAAAGKPGAYPQSARISDLATQLRSSHATPSAIVVDDSLFTGPTVSPAWAPEDVPSEYASAITPALVDGGRAGPADTTRSAESDLAAGHALASALGTPDLPVTRGRAPAGAPQLAKVSSAPIGILIEQMLQESDNVIAECLARQVAIARKLPASFTGAARAVRAVLAGMGVDPGGGMVDGSGLAARDRLSTATLTAVMRLVSEQRPRLHAVLDGLPVGAWSGTLADRYLRGSARGGAGVVRAKTGTLAGVSALAGLVHDRSGRLLVFAVIAERTGPTTSAESALDNFVGKLAACGCT